MKHLFVAISVFFAIGCTTVTVKNDSLGDAVFGVVKRDCIGNEAQVLFCESIQLVELVNGRFYKVKPSETAFVVWHGSKNDLSYSVHNLGQLSREKRSSITVVQEPDYVEILSTDSQGIVSYILGKPNTPSTLTLRALSESELVGFSRAYPED